MLYLIFRKFATLVITKNTNLQNYYIILGIVNNNNTTEHSYSAIHLVTYIIRVTSDSQQWYLEKLCTSAHHLQNTPSWKAILPLDGEKQLRSSFLLKESSSWLDVETHILTTRSSEHKLVMVSKIMFLSGMLRFVIKIGKQIQVSWYYPFLQLLESYTVVLPSTRK